MHNTGTYTLRLPYNSEHGELGYKEVQELLHNALKTHQEFGHVNDALNELNEQRMEYIFKPQTRGVSVYTHEVSEVYGAWRQSIDSLSRKLKTYDDAVQMMPIVKELTYDYERKMGTPIDGVTQSIIEDSDGTYKIVNKPKYYTF